MVPEGCQRILGISGTQFEPPMSEWSLSFFSVLEVSESWFILGVGWAWKSVTSNCLGRIHILSLSLFFLFLAFLLPLLEQMKAQDVYFFPSSQVERGGGLKGEYLKFIWRCKVVLVCRFIFYFPWNFGFRSWVFEVELINLQVLTFPNLFDKNPGRQSRYVFSKTVWCMCKQAFVLLLHLMTQTSSGILTSFGFGMSGIYYIRIIWD